MSLKIINFLFYFFCIFYFIFFMHIPLPTQELSLSSWSLPSNLIAISFASILIFLGGCSIFIKKTITYTSTCWLLIIAFVSLLIPTIFYSITDNNFFIDPLICVGIVGLLFFEMLQLNLSNETRNKLMWLISISGLLQGLLSIASHCGIDFIGKNLSLGAFNNSNLLCIYTCITYTLTLYLLSKSEKPKIFKTFISLLSFFTVTTVAYFSQSLLSIALIIFCHSIYIISNLCISPIKRLPYTLLLFFGILFSGYIATFFLTNCSTINPNIPTKFDQLNYFCNIEQSDIILKSSLQAFSDNLVLGNGFETFERTLLDYQIANNETTYTHSNNGYNIIYTTMSESGILGLCTLFLLFISLLKTTISANRSWNETISQILILIPFFVLALLENPFSNCFIYILIITLLAYCFQTENTVLPSSKTRAISVQFNCGLVTLLITLAYTITAIPSLKTYQQLTNENSSPSKQESAKLSETDISTHLINPFVRYKERTERNFIENSQNSLYITIDLIVFESAENLEFISKYSSNPALFKELSKINQHLAKKEKESNFIPPVPSDFEKKATYYEKCYQLLSQPSLNK